MVVLPSIVTPIISPYLCDESLVTTQCGRESWDTQGSEGRQQISRDTWRM